MLIEASNGVAVDGPWVFRVADTTHALGQLASFHRQRFLHLRVITITGNTGKTTTKELTAAMLGTHYDVLKSPANYNNEVGLSMTLFEANEAHERAVLETGMDRLGEIARLCEIAKPDCAVVLNVGPTHLEKLGSMEAIAQAKGEAVEALGVHGTAILNADDPYVAAMASKCKGRVLTFGMSPGAFVHASDVRTKGLNGVDFQLSCGGRSVAAHSPLPGQRLVYNALAAIAVGVSEGMSVEDAAHALRIAEVPARLQAKLAPSGATILDDCYNASPASTTAALSVLAEMLGTRRLALLGDMLELGSEEAAGHRAGRRIRRAGGRRPVHCWASRRADRRLRPRFRQPLRAPLRQRGRGHRGAARPAGARRRPADQGLARHAPRERGQRPHDGRRAGMTHAMFAACFAMLCTVAVGHPVLAELRRRKFGKGHDEDAPAEYASKVGTPTMGGLMFMIAIVITALVFAVPRDRETLVPLLADACSRRARHLRRFPDAGRSRQDGAPTRPGSGP